MRKCWSKISLAVLANAFEIVFAQKWCFQSVIKSLGSECYIYLIIKGSYKSNYFAMIKSRFACFTMFTKIWMDFLEWNYFKWFFLLKDKTIFKRFCSKINLACFGKCSKTSLKNGKFIKKIPVFDICLFFGSSISRLCREHTPRFFFLQMTFIHSSSHPP